jgi:hypothetical protein
MSTPFYQSLDPQPAPDPITPRTPSADPAGFNSVTPHGQGPAPYDIQADLGAGQNEITAAFDSANAVAGAGVLYPQGPRQRETQVLLESPAGFAVGSGTSGYDILAGYHEGGGDGWPNNVQPSSLLETPDQGQMGTYPANTGTD